MSDPFTRPDANQPAFLMTDDDFVELTSIAHRTFGLDLPHTKRALVYARLSRRLRKLGLSDFAQYRSHLNGRHGAEETRLMLSALTTNVTQFFREKHHFALLEKAILPPLIKAAEEGARLRIWSAGCSSGQEPFSVAATIAKLYGSLDDLDIRILGSDVDPSVLEQAISGTFEASEIASIPDEMRDLMVEEVGRGSERYQIRKNLSDLVSFGELNLVADWPMQGKFDLILCRNVAIYFDAPTQSRMWSRLQKQLTPDGYLLIGHSERLTGPAVNRLKTVGATAFQNAPWSGEPRFSKENKE